RRGAAARDPAGRRAAGGGRPVGLGHARHRPPLRDGAHPHRRRAEGRSAPVAAGGSPPGGGGGGAGGARRPRGRAGATGGGGGGRSTCDTASRSSRSACPWTASTSTRRT